MKVFVLLFLSLNLYGGMFDQMREQFVDQVEMMTETSDLPISAEKDEVLKGREERLDRNEIKQEKELARMRENTDRMHERIKEKELLKLEVNAGGNTYLGITMNMRTNLEKTTEYFGLKRTWTRRSNTNGVGSVSLSGVISQEEVQKYHKMIQDKYKFVDSRSYTSKKINRATSQYMYTNDGDRIMFNIHTTEHKNPPLYEMVIEYMSREELASSERKK